MARMSQMGTRNEKNTWAGLGQWHRDRELQRIHRSEVEDAIALSSNGRTSGSEPLNLGSIPSEAAEEEVTND
jgi:hypothetical protein